MVATNRRSRRGSAPIGGLMAVALVAGLVAGVARPAAAFTLPVVNATVVLGGLLPIGTSTCPLCVNFVTTFDPDTTSGPHPSTTRLQQNLIVGFAYALDVDTALPPLPLAASSTLPVPGYELRAKVTATDASRPTIELDRLPGAPANMPLRVEIVTGDLSTSSADKSTFGYDTLQSNAPAAFAAALDLTDRDHDASTVNSFVSMTIVQPVLVPATELTVVNEGFQGPPAGVRLDRHIRRLTYSGDPVNHTAVPSHASIDFTGAAKSTHVILTHDLPAVLTPPVVPRIRTVLGVELIEPAGGPHVTASLNELPATTDLTIATARLGFPGDFGTRVTYNASAPVASAALTMADSTSLSKATVLGLPASVTLTYVLLGQLSPLNAGGAAITYHASSRATHAELVRVDGARTMTAAVDNVPANITDLHYIPSDAGGHVRYASDGRAGRLTIDVLDGAKTATAQMVNVPATIDLIYSSTDQEGKFAPLPPPREAIHYTADTGADEITIDAADGAKTEHVHLLGVPATMDMSYLSIPGENHVHYAASSVAVHADIKVVDDLAQVSQLAVDLIPATIDIDLLRTDINTVALKDREEIATYRASSEVPLAQLDLTNLQGSADSTKSVHVTLRGIPVNLDIAKTSKTTVDISQVQWASKSPECLRDGGSTLPGCPDAKPIYDTVTRTVDDSELEVATPTIVGTPPEGFLGSGDIFMTNGPDERLPATAANGRSEDGVLYHDLPGDRVVYVHATRVTGLVVHKQDWRTVVTVTSNPGPYHVSSDASSSATHVALDTNAPGDAFGLDLRSRGRASTVSRTALLAQLPGHIQLDLASLNSTIDYSASDNNVPMTVNGYDTPAGHQPGFAYAETTTPDGPDGTAFPPVVTTQASLDPMPSHLHVCQSSDEACSAGLFDQNIIDIINGTFDTWRCFDYEGRCDALIFGLPLRVSPALYGAEQITSDTPTHLTYATLPIDTATSSEHTAVDLVGLRTFTLQADEGDYTCGLQDAACRKGYVALDYHGDADGVIEKTNGSGTTTRFLLASGFQAARHVWAFNDLGNDAGAVATRGRINCPDGTRILVAGSSITNRFCKGELTG